MKYRFLKKSTFIASIVVCFTLLMTGCGCNDKSNLQPYTYVANSEDVIKHDDNKINMYVFFKKKCGHCKKYKDWLDSLDKETRDKFNFYSFEYIPIEGADNSLLLEFLKATNNSIKNIGTPIIIIGTKDFTSGFVNGLTDAVLQEIDDQLSKPKEERYDCYFDSVLPNREIK